ERRGDERDAGAVDAKDREAAEPETGVGADEDHQGDQPAHAVLVETHGAIVARNDADGSRNYGRPVRAGRPSPRGGGQGGSDQSSSWIRMCRVSRTKRPPITNVITETTIGYQRPA